MNKEKILVDIKQAVQAQPAADCGLEVVAWQHQLPSGPSIPLVRKSDADAREVMRLEQGKGLVEALEAVEQEHILRSRMQDCVLRRNGVTFGIAVHSDKHAIEWQALGKELDAMIARRDEALAAYHAAQEGK